MSDLLVKAVFVIVGICLISTNQIGYTKSLFFEEIITIPFDSSTYYHSSNLYHYKPKSLKVALVLSGGGARGIAHIGVIQALEKYHVPVDLVIGCSIGSAVGGFYSAGYSPDKLEEIFKEIDWDNLFNDEQYRINLFWSQKSLPRRHLLELRFDKGIPYIPSSLTPGQKIFDIIYYFLLNANFQAANDFDNLRIPFRAVATDLITGRRVVLEKGDLSEAISGSMAVPLLFSPVEIDGMWLADGGIRDNLPVDVAKENKADLIIAIDVTSPLRTVGQMRSPWQLADQVTTIMMKEPTEESRRLADILITPDLNNFGAGDFSNIDSLIRLGYQATVEKIEDIQQLIQIRQENLWGENLPLGRVASVKVIGLNHISLDSITDKINTKIDNGLNRYNIYEDLLSYYNSGLITEAFAVVNGYEDSLTVEYHLTENPFIRNIHFISNVTHLDTLLDGNTRIQINDIINYKFLYSKIDTLLGILFHRGYSLARVIDMKYVEDFQTIDIVIDAGWIDEINIIGNAVTKDRIISRELTQRKNDIFQSHRVLESIKNIYSTDLFDKVTLNVIRKDSTNTLIIKLKEKKYLLMRLGANASAERQAKAFIELADDNLFGREIKASLFGLIGNLDRRAEFHLYSVRLFNSLLTYRFSLYYRDRWDRYFQEYTQVGRYFSLRRGLNFILGLQISRLGSITGEIRWENIDIHSDYPEFSYNGNYEIRSITIRSVVDKRDKLPFPDTGIYNRWYWESGSQSIFGGSESYSKFHISLEGYYPIIKIFNYHISAAGGSGDATIPFSEFFMLGGIEDFPGLYENEKFGRQVLHLKNELRYNLRNFTPIDLYLGIGFDIGGVWESPNVPIKRSDFFSSWSIYLAANSILGPIRLVYGNLINYRRIVYFSIGYDF